MKSIITTLIFLITIMISSCNQEKKVNENNDILASWTDSKIKKDIISFVQAVCEKSNKSYVEPADRIAVFDLDGTILCEKPKYTEVAFSIYHLKSLLSLDSSLGKKQPYKALIENDEKYFHDSIEKVLITPFIGYSLKQYTDSVLSYFSSVKHPTLQVNYQDLFYKPMLELIEYLKNNDFTVYISSYSQQSFIRSLTSKYLDIDKEHSIGSIVDLQFDTVNNSAQFIREDSFLILNKMKAEVIEYQIGKAPIFVAGNSDGDLEMLNYTNLINPHMVLIIDHDDSNREFEYRKDDLLKTAKEKEWKIVSMKRDFKYILE